MSFIEAMLNRRPKLRLRTKFILSLVLVTVGLTCGTLLVVMRSAESQVQREVAEGARNAILSFRVVQQQQQIALSRKADLLAILAYIRNGDSSIIQDASENPWQSDDCNLFVLADRKGKVVALRATTPALSTATAGELLRRSLKEGGKDGWWLSGKRLYQVVWQSYYSDAPLNNTLLGTVVVGREIDAARATDLGRISASQVVFRIGSDVVVSTLPAFKEQELALLIQDKPVPQQMQIDGEQFFASSVELDPAMHSGLNLTVLKSYNPLRASLLDLKHLLLGLGLIAVLAGVALVFLISDRFTRPLGRLVEGVRAVERGDFTYPLGFTGGDELGQVTRAFDRMRSTLQKNEAQRHQLEDQLRQSQKMEALGRLAGGVAHDFNNLLTVIKGHGDILLGRLGATDSLHLSGQQIVKAADRAAALTRQLLAFCRMQLLQPKVLDLNALVSEMCSLLRRLVREDIAFTFQAGESLGRVKADPGQIEQVIINLTVNACDAMPEGGKLTIQTHNVQVDEKWAATRSPIQPGPYVLLAVTDTGQGMDASTRVRIFEPFFTTKEQGKGTGLGLATVYGVVKQSGGCIWVDSEPGKGARFEVYLPRVEERAESVRAHEIPAASVRRRATVLIAEDEDAVRELASEFVSSAGYTVLAAKDGMEALALAERSTVPIDLLITDVVMPKMRGPELAEQLKKLRPELKIVYMSGYLEYNSGNGQFLEEGFFLQKPFSRNTLVSKADEALSRELEIQLIG
ncbi:MAG TPA: ATP-binding protein [Candidatus Angelobacter sp.]|nr:ATP-binding protein [Candidatus Angelobacter sp.]